MQNVGWSTGEHHVRHDLPSLPKKVALTFRGVNRRRIRTALLLRCRSTQIAHQESVQILVVTLRGFGTNDVLLFISEGKLGY